MPDLHNPLFELIILFMIFIMMAKARYHFYFLKISQGAFKNADSYSDLIISPALYFKYFYEYMIIILPYIGRIRVPDPDNVELYAIGRKMKLFNIIYWICIPILITIIILSFLRV